MANEAEIARFLIGIPLFHGLTERHVKEIAERVRERHYQKDDIIVEQGKMGVGLFIIEKGRVEVRRARRDGTTFVIDELGPTQFFGELSLLDEAPRTASVTALEETVCLALTQLDFVDMLHTDVELSVALLKELAARFRRALSNL